MFRERQWQWVEKKRKRDEEDEEEDQKMGGKRYEKHEKTPRCFGLYCQPTTQSNSFTHTNRQAQKHG